MARYHQRWRVIQFLRRVPRHWTELIPRWKAGLHPGLSLLFLRFVAWIFLERGRAKWPSKERSMGKEGRTTPISSRLFYSSWFFTAALTDAGNHDLEIPLRKDHEERKEDPSFSVHCPPSSSSSTPWSFHYIICIFFFPRLSSCDIFSNVMFELG